MSGADTLFGDYRLIKRIAMGGMAEIYRAQRVGAAGFVRDVVIKRIHPEFSDDDDFIRMFVNEAKLAAMLRHPNIVQVIDFNNVDGTFFIAMELVEGLDLKLFRLRSLRRKQIIPIPLTVRIISEVLKGLSYAHQFTHRGENLHIVHRDISPQNVLVSERGEVKLTDFGIARVMQHASLTAKGVLKGKASYMAPEQTLSSQVDQRADLFSVGIVMWELLTGERLFQADNDILLMEKIRSHPILPPHMKNSSVSEELSQITMRALERSPERRFLDAASFLEELRPWLQSPHLQEELGRWVLELMQPTQEGGQSESQQGPVKKRQTAKLSGWQPPSSNKAAKQSQSASLFVPADELPPRQHRTGLSSAPSPQKSDEQEAGGSWGSFPTLEPGKRKDTVDTEEDWPVQMEEPSIDWDSTATELEPSKVLQLAQELSEKGVIYEREKPAEVDLEATVMAELDLDDTVMVDPGALLALALAKKKSDLPTEKSNEVHSTIQMDPEELIRLRAGKVGDDVALATLTDIPRKAKDSKKEK